MTRILVTGAGGFIGRQLIELLSADSSYEIHGVGRHENPGFACNWHSVDLLATGASDFIINAARPDLLVHLAWNTEPGRYMGSIENFAWVRASLELLMNFRDIGGRRAVIAGTCMEYDFGFGACREDVTPIRVISPYPVCKNALHELTASFSQLSNFSYAWGRVFYLFGPYEPSGKLVSSIITGLLRNERVPCSEGTQRLDFSHVRDVARGLLQVLQSEITGPVNIASGTAVCVKDVVNTIAGSIGRRELVQFGALANDAQALPTILADVEKLRSIGWTPEYDLESGLAQTIRWWRENLFSAPWR